MLFRATFFKYMNKRFSIMSRDYLKWYMFNSIIAIMGVQNKLGWIDRSLGPGYIQSAFKSNKENIESIDEKAKSGVYCNLNHSLLDDPILKLSD